MIQFTFESFYMSVIFSNLMILLLYLLFGKEGRLARAGLSAFGAAVFLVILRMALPYEFLSVSHNVYFKGMPALIVGAIPAENFFDEKLSVWSFIMMAWAAGSVFFAVRFMKEERSVTALLKRNSRAFPPSSPEGRAFSKIREEFPKMRRVRIGTFPGCESPFICGIIKPCIYLPEGMGLTEGEMYYVLRHESAHYLCHDLYIKLFVRILFVIYWWNPVCHFLSRKVDTLLEMRVDKNIAKQPVQKEAYLGSLLSVAKYTAGKGRAVCSGRIIPFCGEGPSELSQRFSMLLHEEKKLSWKLGRALFLAGVAALFVLSYVYIFEPYYKHPEDMIGVTSPGSENAYFIERKDGRYDFYLEGEYVSTEDSLEYYRDDIPIYKEGTKIE